MVMRGWETKKAHSNLGAFCYLKEMILLVHWFKVADVMTTERANEVAREIGLFVDIATNFATPADNFFCGGSLWFWFDVVLVVIVG